MENSTTRTVKLDTVYAAIRQAQAFLTPYLGLANTHGAEFLSNEHWNSFVSKTAQSSLLRLSNEDLVNLSLLTVQESCEKTSSPYPLDDTPESNVEASDFLKTEDHKIQELGSFISQARKCHLDSLDVLSPLDVVLSERLTAENPSTTVVSEAMSEKKHHEVGIMVDSVSALYRLTKSNLVVDVGSGKGYFASELSLKHKIPVIGFDSSDINTHGASQRDKKLAKKWSGLERKLKKKKHETSMGLKTGKVQDSQENQSSHLQNVSRPHDALLEESSLPTVSRDQHANAVCDDSAQVLTSLSPTTTSTTVQPSGSFDDPINTGLSLKHNGPTCDLYVPVTLYVQPGMDLCEVIQQKAPHHMTMASPKLFLTGLHTCGSLAVTTVNLFLQDRNVVGLCCVGCCYQLMEECRPGQSANIESDLDQSNTGQEYHFPISHYGRRLGLELGRNARNLASQSVHRIHASGQLQGGDFLWRALLNVLLTQLCDAVPERIIGMRGLNKKCSNFQDYAQAAFQKLGLSHLLPEPGKIEWFEAQHKETRAKMSAFFQLKLVLAPVIEALILLDRLAFLLEQDSVYSAHLVQLFDPVMSPRCFALIAWKERGCEESS